jgi:hypothetical protein
MEKNNFKYHFRIAVAEELEKHDIHGIVTVLEKAIANIFEASEDGTAVIYHKFDDRHLYDFRMNRSVTEAEAEVILGLLNEWTDLDYTMEITTSEKYDLPEGEYETDLTSMKHNKWIAEQVNQGWRYGLEYSEEEKTDPRLRPYHELSEKLKNM